MTFGCCGRASTGERTTFGCCACDGLVNLSWWAVGAASADIASTGAWAFGFGGGVRANLCRQIIVSVASTIMLRGRMSPPKKTRTCVEL